MLARHNPGCHGHVRVAMPWRPRLPILVATTTLLAHMPIAHATTHSPHLAQLTRCHWRLARQCVPEPTPEPSTPPIPKSLDTTDPMIRDLIEDHLATLESDPTPTTWLALAEAYDANDFLPEAAACYETALGLDLPPTDAARAWYLLALVRNDLGDLGPSLDALDNAEAIDPAYAPIHWRRGYWLLDDGRTDDAEHAFDKAPTAEPSRFGLARVALARRDAAAARAILEPLARSSNNPRYAHRLLAAAYAMQGDRDRAAIAMAVGAPPAWSDPWLADVLRQRTGYDAGMDHIRALADDADPDAALALIDELLTRWPDDPALLNFRGYALVLAGRRADALAVWRTALDHHDDSALLHLNIGAVLAEDALRAGEPTDEAMAHIDRALELNPDSARIHEVKGALLAATGHADEAVPELRRAFDLDPANPNVARQLTQLLMARADWPGAEHVLQRWTLIQPQSPQAQLSLAIALMRTSRLDEAAEALDRGAALLPADHPQVRQLRAELERLRDR